MWAKVVIIIIIIKHQGLEQLDPFRLQSYNCSG